jgi:tRNA dimethylallyltransferase
MKLDKKDKTLIVIAGPTAVGKTAWSLKLAQEFKTDIISADSRQIFNEMTIGTAKPTSDELSFVKHHFINHCSIHQPYSVGDFEREALSCVEKLFQEKGILLCVGGSGLYLKAFTEGLDEVPSAAPEIRENLQKIFQQEGLVPLLAQLEKLDPWYYKKVDQANPQRIIRALEVSITTQTPYSDFLNKKTTQRPFKIIKIGLQRPREELYQRINQRVLDMMEQGWLQEARELFDFRQLNALQTVGYKELFDFLEGKYDWTTTVQQIQQSTRRFAKRQMTWFRRDTTINWINADDWDAGMEYIKKRLDLG